MSDLRWWAIIAPLARRTDAYRDTACIALLWNNLADHTAPQAQWTGDWILLNLFVTNKTVYEYIWINNQVSLYWSLYLWFGSEIQQALQTVYFTWYLSQAKNDFTSGWLCNAKDRETSIKHLVSYPSLDNIIPKDPTFGVYLLCAAIFVISWLLCDDFNQRPELGYPGSSLSRVRLKNLTVGAFYVSLGAQH